MFGSEEKQGRETKNRWVPHDILSPDSYEEIEGEKGYFSLYLLYPLSLFSLN